MYATFIFSITGCCFLFTFQAQNYKFTAMWSTSSSFGMVIRRSSDRFVSYHNIQCYNYKCAHVHVQQFLWIHSKCIFLFKKIVNFSSISLQIYWSHYRRLLFLFAFAQCSNCTPDQLPDFVLLFVAYKGHGRVYHVLAAVLRKSCTSKTSNFVLTGGRKSKFHPVTTSTAGVIVR